MKTEHKNRVSKNYVSVEKIWADFIENQPQFQQKVIPESFYFCDNLKDANECADLVLEGTKKATASSLKWFKSNNIEFSKPGDLFIITNWDGVAKAVIQIEKIEFTPYTKITPEFAQIEGEGDKSLAYWKKVHKAYYCREQNIPETEFDENMMIVCEYFKCIYPKK